jgi:hypothetical protein
MSPHMDRVHNETIPARNLAPPPVCHKIKHCYRLLHVSRDRALHAHADFRQDLMRGRELRGDFSFGEQILDIADNTADWYNEKTGKLSMNKELVLRAKLRIGARQFHMSRLHVQTWGEKQTIDIKSDWALLSEEERRRKADELITMIRELKEPPMQPTPLIYRPEEALDDEPANTGGIGSRPSRWR